MLDSEACTQFKAAVPGVAATRATVEARLSRLGQVAEGWLNVGEVDKARPLIRDGLELFAVLREPELYPPSISWRPRGELSLIGCCHSSGTSAMPPATRRSCYAAVAESLANRASGRSGARVRAHHR